MDKINEYHQRRGDVFMVCFDPVFGREIGGFKLRPAVVISINDINGRTRLVTVIPGTDASRKDDKWSNVARVEPTRKNGLTKATEFQCHQIRAIERGRFTAKRIGSLSIPDFERIERAIRYTLMLPEKSSAGPRVNL